MTTSNTNTRNIVFGSQKDAELVRDALSGLLKRFNVVSIQDLNDLSGLPSTYQDNKRGWTVLNNIGIKQVEKGYILDLPPTEEI